MERARGARCSLKLDPCTLPAERYQALALRVGQSTEAKNTAEPRPGLHDRSLERIANRGDSREQRAPAPVSGRRLGAGKIVMQTLRLPIASLVERGVDPNDIRSVAFLFDRRSSGTLYVGDVQVSN